MQDNLTLIGLDFETSTGNTATLAPIQIGIVAGGETYESLIGGWTFNSNPYWWSMESQKVHNIEEGKLYEQPGIFEVDLMAAAWLFQRVKTTPRMNRVAMGWNVGSFDRAIVQKFMPILDQVLSYRTCDLNTVCYVVATQLNTSFEKLKREAKAYSEERIGQDIAQWHDALYDARAGMFQWEYLTKLGVEITEERVVKQK
jgi:hypothetical protein